MTKLKNIPDKSPFKVPDNYFEQVNRKIISAASGYDTEIRKIRPYNRFRTSLLIAASVAAFVVISFTAVMLFTPDKSNSRVSGVLNEINPNSYINDIDIMSLEEDASSLILSGEGPEAGRNDIIDYLLLENIELNEIYEHL